MAKKALLGVLESTIGKYVLDLDAEKLNLGIWSGKVELHDLQLDTEACNAELDRQAAEAPNLAVPLKVVGGQFQSVLLEIPWTGLTNQSVVMKAQGLHIHVAPHDRLAESDFMKLAVSSEDKRAQHIQEQRAQTIVSSNENRLQRKELMKLTELGEDDEDNNGKDDSGFVARLVKRIVENLQVEINDVKVTLEGQEGTAGIILENMSFVTTDMAGHRTFVDRTGDSNPSDLLNKFLYKKLQIQGFGLFVEPSSKTKSKTEGDHKYVLDPLTFEATLREADVSITKDYPKWLLKSKVPAVQLGLSQTQYQETMGLLAAMAPSPHAARPIFPEYRPLHRITKRSAKDWWHYAYRCVGRLTGRRSWMAFFEAFQSRKTYIALYKRKAHCDSAKWLKPLTIEEEADVERVENDRSISIEGIMLWRNLADAQVEKERSKRQEQEPKAAKRKSGGMLSNLFGGTSKSSSDEEEEPETPISLSLDELKELEEVGLEEINELDGEAKLCRVEFVLGEFQIHLAKAADQPMMGLEMGRVSASFESDVGGSFDFEYSLQSLEILDHLHSSSLFPRILRSLQGPEGAIKSPTPQNEDVFQVHMSKSKKGDKKLTVKLVPFEAVIAPHLTTELMDFVTVPEAQAGLVESPHIEEIEEDEDGNDISVKRERIEASTTSEYTEGISNALVDAWREKTKDKTTLSIDLDLQAPILVLPENCSDPKANVIVVDLGGFRFQYGSLDASPKVTQWLMDNPRDAQSNNLSAINENQAATSSAGTVVDHGRLELENMTLLVGEAESWRRIKSMRENHMAEQESIIEPITVRFDFAVESVVSSSIPRACVFTTIAASNFKISPHHLYRMLRVYNTWMSSLEQIRGDNSPAPSNRPGLEDTKRTSAVPPAKKRESTQTPEADGKQEVVLVEIEEVTKTLEKNFTDDTALFTTIYLDITAEKYSCVIYDSGDFQKRDGFNVKNDSPVANVAEGLVLQGRIQLTVSLSTDKGGETSKTALEISGREFEMYSGFGRDMRRPLQILEPVTGSLKLKLQRQGMMATKTDLKARCHDAIDLTFSMRNLALVNAISTELSQCLQNGLKRLDDSVVEPMEALDQDTTNQIEALASTLESDGSKPGASVKLIEGQTDDTTVVGINNDRASSSIVTLNVKIPQSKLTIINDLQGLDEALFRIETEQLIVKGMLAQIKDLDDSDLAQSIYNIKLHAKMLADYFDPSVNSWKPLLKKPWGLELKSERAADKTSKCGRFHTKADVHFFPIHLSFSEHFLIGLGSLSRMLSMSAELENESRNEQMDKSGNDGFNPRASATRNLVAALPYALDNFSGIDVEYYLAESQVGNRPCANGSKQYFRFNPPKGRGCGGKKLYGEDVVQDLSIKLIVGKDETIEIERIDDELGKPKRCHILKDGTMLVTTVVKEGLSTVVRLSSNFYMRNRTPIPVSVALMHDSKEFDLGLCQPTSSLLDTSGSHLVPYNVKDGTLSKPSLRLGLRFDGMVKVVEAFAKTGKGTVTMKISPLLDGVEAVLHGMMELEIDTEEIAAEEHNTMHMRVDVLCSSSDPNAHDFALQAAVKLQLIEGKRIVAYIALEPRAMLVSTIPVRITVLTRLPHCYSSDTVRKAEKKDSAHTLHELEPGSKVEVYSPGEALAVKLRLTEIPIDGTPTGTSKMWIQVPLTSQLEKPILCLLPFIEEPSSSSPGSEFFIAEATPQISSFFLERINDDGKLNGPGEAIQSSKPTSKTLLLTVGNYGIDHTGSILFEQMMSKSKGFFRGSTSKPPNPFGAFAEEGSEQRLSLLPTSEIPIRLVRLGKAGAKRTALFRVEEVSMTKGGAQATPLLWEDGYQSGYFAYRQLVSSFQSELHVIPEFLVFNGSKRHHVVVQQSGAKGLTVAPGASAPIFSVNHDKGLPLSFHYKSIGGATRSIRLEELGLHIELVQNAGAESLGSLAIQTSIGSNDSRLLIKLGEVGEIEREPDRSPVGMLPKSFVNDTLRCRIQADEFAVTLNQAISSSDDDGVGILQMASTSTKSAPKAAKTSNASPKTEKPICTIMLKHMIYDVQKLFKEKEELADEKDVSERCQLSLIVHDFKIKDETPRSPYPTVFEYTGQNRFLDFCIRTKGPLYDRNVKVDLFDLILAHSGKGNEQSTDKMFLQTSEDFVWKLLDTADLISEASKEPTDKSDFDKALAAYVPSYAKEEPMIYTPPQVASIYDLALARVSPFNLIVSFKRRPEASRYDKFINNEGAHLMRYFTQQLKFTIDHCDLRFARYEEKGLKGPRDRLVEILTAVYVSRMKLKVVTILAAASFGDWKDLAARDGGDDEFVDGDLLRVTGSVAGNSVAFAFNKVGKGLGKSVTMGLGAVGDGVENGAALVGAGGLGLGVNQVISGAGGFVGGTLQGVGEGTGNLFKGAGQGLGHFFGGISGGGSRIVKGVGKSITTGDGGAMATGFKEGLQHMGSGVQNSVKAVGTGVGGSVTSVVRGSVSGVRESVNSASSRSSKRASKKHATGLAQLREEFKDQDYS